MTPDQYDAARNAHTQAVAALQRYAGLHSATLVQVFMHHTEVLAGHLARALAADPDPFAGLTGPEAVGADPTANTPRMKGYP